MPSLFARQLATYASYHRDARNRTTHFIGIPAIVFAILLPLALLRAGGISSAMVLAEWIARTYSSATVWVLFAVFFVGGWAFQLVGHAWEGRRPALADNLFQAFIGPMFLMAEVLMALGLKQDLKAAIDGAR
jgi:uncharacterized membrane protein YGL010W